MDFFHESRASIYSVRESHEKDMFDHKVKLLFRAILKSSNNLCIKSERS